MDLVLHRGGFGVGSDLTIHVLTSVPRQASDPVVVVLGYRYIDFDC